MKKLFQLINRIVCIFEFVGIMVIIFTPKEFVTENYLWLLLPLSLAGVFQIVEWVFPLFKSPKLISYDYNDKTEMLTLVYEDHTEKYTGCCTVWYYYPSGNRCESFKESKLCNIWNKWRRDLMISKYDKDNIS